MCELHQIDLIVTKSVSRFARNVKEALEYVRNLKLLGVGVIFEKEGINTMSLGDEMLLNTSPPLPGGIQGNLPEPTTLHRQKNGAWRLCRQQCSLRFHLENKQLVEYLRKLILYGGSSQHTFAECPQRKLPRICLIVGCQQRTAKRNGILQESPYMLSNER